MSKIISGMRNVQAVLLKSGTAFATRVGGAHRMRSRLSQSPVGSTFYAALTSNTRDAWGAVDTFSRASQGLYKDASGNWQVAANNVARFEGGMILMEPQATNDFLNSSTPATQSINLTTGEHTLSVHGTGSVTSSDNGGTATGHGTATDGNSVTIDVTSAGGILFSVSGTPEYVQVEDGRAPSSPIVTGGSPATREADILTYADLMSFYSQTEGMAFITWSPKHDKADYILGLADSEGLISVNDAFSRFMRLLISTTKVVNLNSFDGTNNAALPIGPDYLTGDMFRTALRWFTGPPSALQIGYSRNGGTWVWSTEFNYDGAYPVSTELLILQSLTFAKRASHVTLYDKAEDSSWIEDNFPS